VDDQIKLYHNIKPLFANKLTFIVVNKIDLLRPDQLDAITQEKIQGILKAGEVEMLQISCTTTEGVMQARNAACDRLIAMRNAEKLKAGTNSAGDPTGRLAELIKRIHVAQPLGGIVREVHIPDAVKNKMKYDKDDPNRPKLERDLQEENGGPGVYNIDLKKNYLLDDDEWRQDRMPEIMDGRNVADFFVPDIEARLDALEEEEERLEGEGFYDEDGAIDDDETATLRYRANLIREKRQLIRNEARLRKGIKNRSFLPRPAQTKKLSDMTAHLNSLGFSADRAASRARSQSRGRSAVRAASVPDDAMDVDQTPKERLKSMARSQSTNRRTDGVTNVTAKDKAERLAKLGQIRMNRMARAGEADRHTTSALPKHLFSGKRGMGKTQRR